MKKHLLALGVISSVLITSAVYAEKVTIKMYTTDQAHTFVGKVIAEDSKHGLVLKPHLKGLPPGDHGFHVHAHASCDHNGIDAAGHLDPANTGKHLGPYSKEGHLGDLPVLVVNAKGVANQVEVAPRLTVKAIKGGALMIHVGGDNYSDQPQPLGGGGARMVCGIIP